MPPLMGPAVPDVLAATLVAGMVVDEFIMTDHDCAEVAALQYTVQLLPLETVTSTVIGVTA